MKECLKNIDEEILNIQNNYWEENIMNENPLKIENGTLNILIIISFAINSVTITKNLKTLHRYQIWKEKLFYVGL